jgi:hypothetical protein
MHGTNHFGEFSDAWEHANKPTEECEPVWVVRGFFQDAKSNE